MAITSTGRYGSNITLPSGYTNPSQPAITEQVNDTDTVDLAATAANINEVTGATDLMVAFDAHLVGAFATAKGLDAVATTQINATITSIKRMNDGDDTGIFKAGTEVYRISFSYAWD